MTEAIYLEVTEKAEAARKGDLSEFEFLALRKEIL